MRRLIFLCVARREIGIVKVNMFPLLSAASFPARDGGAPLRVLDSYYPIHQLEGETTGAIVQRGALRVVLSLEELGVTDQPAPEPRETDARSVLPSAAYVPPAGPSERDGPEYQVAWELELWRAAEMSKHANRMRELETHRLQELEEEWRAQEAKRLEAAENSQREMAKLERRMKDAMFEIERKARMRLTPLLFAALSDVRRRSRVQEKRLALREEETEKRAAALERDYEQHKQEVLLTVKRCALGGLRCGARWR